MQPASKNTLLTGIGLAVLATIIWSGNFIVARGVIKQIPPVSLAFYRWVTAIIILAPFAIQTHIKEFILVKQHLLYLFCAALFGVSLFNTLVYMAGHYTNAINLALLGTTSSPIFSFIIAAIFLKEKMPPLRIAGLFVCIAGILLLLSKGYLPNLLHLKFGKGDVWVLAGALAFAIYNALVRKKPAGISPVNFLFITFIIGALILLPFFLVEKSHAVPVIWSSSLVAIILYLGAGASVLAFLLWNAAIARLGAARTAIFGNLIPVFSTIEAVIVLHENINWVHITSLAVVTGGILLANVKKST